MSVALVLTVLGGSGAQTITLASLDANATGGGPALTAITLSGDNTFGTDTAANTINVRMLPATINATLVGRK